MLGCLLIIIIYYIVIYEVSDSVRPVMFLHCYLLPSPQSSLMTWLYDNNHIVICFVDPTDVFDIT